MSAPDSLDGKVIAITGAGSGIGRAIALACSRRGASLCLSGRTVSQVEETVALLKQENEKCRAIAVQVDIASMEDIESMFCQTTKIYGRLDAVVANAGVMAPSPPVYEYSPAAWHAAIATNILGTVQTVSAGSKILVEQGKGGSILATGSSIAIRTSPSMSTYSATKAAIHAYMKVAALDLAPHRIRANTLVPGTSATPPLQQIPGLLERAAEGLPLGEVVSTEELGRYAAFLLSDAVPHMTGASLVVDSGRTVA